MTMHVGMRGGASIRSFTKDPSVRDHQLRAGTARRVARYGRPFGREIGAYLVLTIIAGALVTAVPLLLQRIIDDGVEDLWSQEYADLVSLA